MKPIVYLAGPISGLSWNGATNWRAYAKSWLMPEIDALSPLRYQEHMSTVEKFSADASEAERLQCPMSTPRGLTVRDRFDAMRCNVLLVNLLGADERSVGTILEFGWANAVNTPIVVAMEDKGNPHDHAMINEITGFRVNNLDQALRVTRSILLP